jgi:hypothetical protein
MYIKLSPAGVAKMQNPPANDVDQEKYNFLKKQIQAKDHWMVLKFIFTGKLLDLRWTKELQ